MQPPCMRSVVDDQAQAKWRDMQTGRNCKERVTVRYCTARLRPLRLWLDDSNQGGCPLNLAGGTSGKMRCMSALVAEQREVTLSRTRQNICYTVQSP